MGGAPILWVEAHEYFCAAITALAASLSARDTTASIRAIHQE
jgi:hypothetical protein